MRHGAKIRILFSCIMLVHCVIGTKLKGAEPDTLVLEKEVLPNPENEPKNVFPLPSKRQVLWNETEFYAFFHFGMNTFTGKEWGYGDEKESLFQPTEVPDPEQWLTACKAAGMKGGIAVVKHHDGFCLWPTATTTHSVVASENANGCATNIPRDFVAAAEKLGMKYGFYISPWDRNSAYWGDGTSNYLNKVFIPQCEELTKYGTDQFEMWFDGAVGGDGYYGGAANPKRSIFLPVLYYDIPNLRWKIHQLQPNCVAWGVGEEARWVGNELGIGWETCWSPSIEGDVDGDENGWKWYPSESDARGSGSGWFYHVNYDVKELDQLWKMYMETVGRNSTLILNFPPDQTGKLHANYVNQLYKFGEIMQERLGTDLALTAHAEVSEARASGVTRTYGANNLIDGDADTYWAPNDATIASTITLSWDAPQTIHYVALQEYIRKGQRIKAFKIESSDDGVNFVKQGGNVVTTTVGYKRIIPMNGSTEVHGDGISAKYIRITIEDAKSCPLLHTVSVY